MAYNKSDKGRTKKASYAQEYLERPGVRDRVNARKRELRQQRKTTSARPCPNFCECCGRPHSNLRYDHDHETGAFRGWLCDNCNTAIGKLGDTVDGLQRAIEYLRGELPWQ